VLADVDGLIKTLVFALFFLAPVVKSILDAKKKQREAEARRQETPSTEVPEADAGRAAWEALLRGEPLDTAAPAAPVQPAEPSRAEPRPRRAFEEAAPERPYASTVGSDATGLPRGMLTSQGVGGEGREVLTESEPLTAGRASTETESLTDAPALTDSPALTDTPSSEGLPISKLVAQGEFQGLGTASVASEVSVEPVRRRARALAQTRADWRRAIVLSEVLAPPVSMRRWRAGDPSGADV
jgi:hypothetical protein